MKAEVDAVLRNGDTVGGVFEVVARQCPAWAWQLCQLG